MSGTKWFETNVLESFKAVAQKYEKHGKWFSSKIETYLAYPILTSCLLGDPKRQEGV